MCFFEATCFKGTIETVKENPVKTCGLYLVIMAIFIIVMVSQNISLQTRAIVGYSMAGLHAALLIGALSIRNKPVSKEPMQQARREPLTIEDKNRADRQMAEMFQLPQVGDEEPGTHIQGQIAEASYHNGSITFDQKNLTSSIMEGFVSDPSQKDGYECTFYVVRCQSLKTNKIFELIFFQRQFLSDKSDGEFYIQGNYPPELFGQSFKSFTENNLDKNSPRVVRFKQLLGGKLKDFKLV